MVKLVDSKMLQLQRTYDVCQCYLDDLCNHYSSLTPLWERVRGKLRARDLKGLTSVSEMFDSEYHRVDVLRHLMQIEAFFSKNKSFADEERCLAAANEAFHAFEDQCAATNLYLHLECVERIDPDPDLDLILDKMRRYIRNVLGDFNAFLEELPERIDITDGASARSSRAKSKPYHKVKYKLDATPGAVPYLDALYRYYGFRGPRVQALLTNRVEVVLKNWKTHRTIGCEPEGVIPLQLAFDSYAKDRLRLFGIDLRDQSLNQRMSYTGSVFGSIATIDLKGASDTTAKMLVPLVFDYEWWKFLDDLRSPCFAGPFGTGLYSKFSSMGNGTTFCIETLIFAAACYAVGSKQFSVYGDDIAIETELAEELMDVLRRIGFIVNQDKSHFTGSFRESCGANWYQGQDVTPFYMRTAALDRVKPIACHVINGLASVSIPGGKLWYLLKTFVEKEKLPIVPYNDISTSGIWVDVHTAYETKLFRWNKRFQVLKYKGYSPKVKPTYKGDWKTLILWHLYRKLGREPRKERHYPFPKFATTANWGMNQLRAYDLSTWLDMTQLTALKTSTVHHDQHKYVRSWRSWLAPAKATPVHLFWWSEFIVRGRTSS